jgi:hypothetical protein
MPTIEDELQDLLASYGEAPAGTDRLAAVRRRITHRRQLTIAGATAAILVVAVAIPVAISLGGRLGRADGPGHQATSPVPNPTPPGPIAMVMPEFSNGYRRVAQATAAFPDQMRFELVYTPSSPHYRVYADCRTEPSLELWVQVKDAPPQYADHRVVDCYPDYSTRLGMSPVDVTLFSTPMDNLGTPIDDFGRWPDVTVGQPVTLVVTLRTWGVAEPGLTGYGRAIVGVYEPVPIADFPLPPPPAQLADLDQLTQIPPTWELAPKPEQLIDTLDSRTLPSPSGTFELTVPMPARMACAVDSVGPGELSFAVAGFRQIDVIFWDWGGRTAYEGPRVNDAAKYGIPVGDPLTITVTASRFDVPAWRLRCYDLGP